MIKEAVIVLVGSVVVCVRRTFLRGGGALTPLAGRAVFT